MPEDEDSPVQIFISYAWRDNVKPPGFVDAKGFVTTLHEYLDYAFDLQGYPNPCIWRDKGNVEDGQQFDPLIKKAIDNSSLFLVILSRRWLYRPFCLKELALFRERWRHESDSEVRHRIIVVRKNFVEQKETVEFPHLFDEKSGWLAGQAGYDFYKFDGPKEAGKEREFFEAQKQPQSHEFVQKATDLGRYLWLAAKREAPERTPESRPGRRVIYVAKPALDMLEAHQRISTELTRRGFDVLPGEIPLDHTAEPFIDKALQEAEFSVHLVGADAGFAPARADRILPLQLARAAIKIEAGAKEELKSAVKFHRIIFAPKMHGDSEPRADEAERDPLTAKLARFGASRLDSDKAVLGKSLSAFEDFLYDYLTKGEPPRNPEPLPDRHTKVYLCHSEDDSKYALDLAADMQKLEKLKIEPLLPVLEGTDTEVKGWHERNLRQCHIVIVCWADASEHWVRAAANELKAWKAPTEAQKFAFRGLIAGPPKRPRKQQLLPLPIPPRTEIDKILDLMEPNRPVPEALNEWFRGAGPTPNGAAANAA